MGPDLTASSVDRLWLKPAEWYDKADVDLRTGVRVTAIDRSASEVITDTGERIAYAAHSDGLKSMLTVTENLKFWAQVFGTADISPAIEAFDLIPLRDRLAGSLSAGQKRRLGLARLMVTGRPVWVLDEPTVSLDTASVALFADAVRAHLAGGGSALMATHIDLGLEADVLDVTPFKAKPRVAVEDEAFL